MGIDPSPADERTPTCQSQTRAHTSWGPVRLQRLKQLLNCTCHVVPGLMFPARLRPKIPTIPGRSYELMDVHHLCYVGWVIPIPQSCH